MKQNRKRAAQIRRTLYCAVMLFAVGDACAVPRILVGMAVCGGWDKLPKLLGALAFGAALAFAANWLLEGEPE